jgi:hypothetical protein
MRTKSAQAVAVLGNPSHSARIIATVYNASNVATELSEVGLAAYGVRDPIMGAEVEQSIDTFRTARVRLLRQQGKYSFAPLVTSPLGTLIQVGWRIVLECELLLPDITVTPAGLREVVFDGYIDEMQWPGDELELICTDQSARLRDTWIQRERVYGLANGVNATKGCYVWRYDLHTLQVGDLVIPSDARRNGHFYAVIAAASPQSAAEPTWPTGTLATVVSGGVTLQEAGPTSEVGIDLETIIQQILNDNGLSSIIFECAISPAWLVKPYIQQRESVMTAIQTMVDQLGWWIRFEWDAGYAAYVLTLEEPDRSSGTVHKTIDEADELECTELGVDVWSIRNRVRVVYGDSSSRSPSGSPQRVAVEVEDATSITKYGGFPRFMEVGEDDASNIDTLAEATRLANAILADLKEPLAGLALAFSVDPYLELGDRITVPGDGLRFTSSQTLAVESLRHKFDGTSARTSVRLSGAPAARREGWLIKDGRANPSDVHQLSLANNVTQALATTSTVGGQRFSITGNRSKDALNNANELHISTSPNFTPSAATLAASGEASAFDVPDLVPGKPYYAKTIPFSKNADRIVRGEPSTEISFIAGRARAGHYDSSSTQSHLPLNGNFEHASDNLASAPPDQWQVVTRPSETAEVWGSGGSVFHGTDSSKGRYIELRASATQRGNLVSSPFEVRRGCRSLNIYLSIMRLGSSAVSLKDLIVDVSLYSDAALTTLVRTDSIFLSGSASGPYPSLSTWYDAVIDYGGGYGALPTNANFMVIALRRSTTGDNSFSWRVGDVYVQESDFYRAQIDQQSFITVASTVGFATGWADFGGSFPPAAYMKDSMGFVHLRGVVKRVSGAGLPIFTLPAGYRPEVQFEFFPVQATSAYGDVQIDGTPSGTPGRVALGVGTTSYISLSGITFKAG